MLRNSLRRGLAGALTAALLVFSGAALAGAKPRPQPRLRVVVPESMAAATTGITHSVNLSWTASTSAAGCTSPCVFGYNVFRGTAAAGESATPLNATPVTATTFSDVSITIGSSPVTYYYVVQAVETVGTIVASSANSNEVSQTFPGQPAAPTVSITSSN